MESCQSLITNPKYINLEIEDSFFINFNYTDVLDFELSKYHKNPYEHIYKHQELKEILKDVECVHIYGFSFSSVDEDYMDWFFNNVPATSQWEVSYFSSTDKKRIDGFILEHWSLKNRLRLRRTCYGIFYNF